MKKKAIFAAVAAVVAICANIGINIQQNNAMSDIQMANVEALGRDEQVDVISCHSNAKENYGRSYTDCSECKRIVNWEGIKKESRCTRR